MIAREIRARSVVSGLAPGQIAEAIHDACEPVAGTTWIRAHRLALGISLADVVAQVRARYASEGRAMPRFSETLLSAYESGQKRPGPEYLHYLCAVYQAEPTDFGYQDHCFCGRPHREVVRTPRIGLARPPAGGTATGGMADGAGEPTPPAAAGLTPGQEPGRPGQRSQWLEMSGPAAGRGPGLSEPGDAEDEEDHDALRHALLRMISNDAPPLDGAFLGAVDRIRRRVDDALTRGTVSATMLDQWEETTAGYGRQYMTVAPLRLLCDVLLDLGDVRRMCEHRQPLEYSERLCRLAGRLSGLAGVIMIDVGDQRLARSFFRTARAAADETGDRHLRAWVAVREALVPMYYGDPREACTLARSGGDLAGASPCMAGSMGPMLEARALARAATHRDGSGKRQALRRVKSLVGQAHDVFGRLADAERGDTAFGYTERQLFFHEGDALVTLGEHQAAESAFSRAMLRYAPEERLDRALITLGVARCRLEAAEPEEALRLSRDTLLGMAREHRSQIVVATARALGESVAGRHGEFGAVREYREALLTA